MKKLTHIDARGEASMVDVSAKPVMFREAVASGEVRLQKATLKLIASQTIAKGNVMAAARLAGILAAKKTGELIPLCHPLPLTYCEVSFAIPSSRDRILITASAKVAAQTGVEMEALTAVRASISTPVWAAMRAVAVIAMRSRVLGMLKLTSQCVSGSGWQSGMSSPVFLAARIPASRAAARTLPLAMV